MVDIAVRTAYARRGVAHLTVPNDIQVANAGAEPVRSTWARPGRRHTAPILLPGPGPPRDADLQQLADVLNAGEKVAILAGAGALHAREELLAVAETLGAPIIKTLSGKATVPDDSPYTTGGIGLLGTAPSEELMERPGHAVHGRHELPLHQALLPEPGKVAVAQIEADPARAGARIATEVPVVGDAKESLQALLPLLKQRTRHLVPGEVPEADGDAGASKMAALQDRAARPDRPAVRGRRAGRTGRRRRDADLRQRDDRHLGRAALADPRRPASSSCPATWPRWHPGCRTRSGSSTRSPAAR